MFEPHTEELRGGRGIKLRVHLGRDQLTFAGAVQRWRDDPAFRSFFITLLAEAPYAAFRWETPPVTRAGVDRRFEFVLLDSPWLDTPPDPEPFGDLFAAAPDRDVIAFPNLGHDARLVAPLPRGPREAYTHLAAFSRRAPEAQKHALWQAVGEAVGRAMGERPLWVSTAGGGVAWLHVRLDSWPKYYVYAPYREAP